MFLGLFIAVVTTASFGHWAAVSLTGRADHPSLSGPAPEVSASLQRDRSDLPDSAASDPLGPCHRLSAGLSTLGGAAGFDSLAILTDSGTGAWLMAQARRRGVTVCLDPNTALNGYYRAQKRLVGLNSHLTTARQVGFLAHELGHVLQHPTFSNNRYLAPRDMILLRRLREAAAEAIATRLLWQLRRAGNAAPWNAKQRTGYRDILVAFEKAHQSAVVAPITAGPAHPGGMKKAELAATRAAFKQWFAAKWRRDTYDAMTLQHLETIAGDRLGLVSPRFMLSEAYLAPLARHQGETFLLPGDRLRQAAFSRRLAPGTVARLETLETLIMAGRTLAAPHP